MPHYKLSMGLVDETFSKPAELEETKTNWHLNFLRFPPISVAKHQIGRKSFAKKNNKNTVTIESWVKFHLRKGIFFVCCPNKDHNYD